MIELKKTILIAEDNIYLRMQIADALPEKDLNVLQADCGAEALRILQTETVDLMLLDIDLGDINGLEILRILRSQFNSLPVIVITTFSQLTTRLQGFMNGCDDYLTKPFVQEELVMRLERLLVLTDTLIPRPLTLELSEGDFRIDFANEKIYRNSRELDLNPKLFQLLCYMILKKDRLLTKEELFENIWGYDRNINSETLTSHIYQLRKQIEKNPKNPLYITTLRGKGFSFQPCGEAGKKI